MLHLTLLSHCVLRAEISDEPYFRACGQANVHGQVQGESISGVIDFPALDLLHFFWVTRMRDWFQAV